LQRSELTHYSENQEACMRTKLRGVNALYPTPTTLVGALVNDSIKCFKFQMGSGHDNRLNMLDIRENSWPFEALKAYF
jgi:hypothetical protein